MNDLQEIFKRSKDEVDFVKIRRDCPKAWDKLMEWVSFKFGTWLLPMMTDRILANSKDGINQRDLYDFFDAKGVYISLACNNEWDNPQPIGFMGEIFSALGECLYTPSDDEFTSRTLAESAAFEKAFSILETTLSTTPNKQ